MSGNADLENVRRYSSAVSSSKRSRLSIFCNRSNDERYSCYSGTIRPTEHSARRLQYWLPEFEQSCDQASFSPIGGLRR